MRPLEPWHRAWLAAHEGRTEDWLRDRLRDGFDVHHMDGDKGNNDPANLVLIEHVDHMRLHSGGWTMGRLRHLRVSDLRPAKARDAPPRASVRRWEKTRARMIEKLHRRGLPIPDYLLN